MNSGIQTFSVVAETICWFQSDDTLAGSVFASLPELGAMALRRLQQKRAVAQNAASVNAVWEGSGQLRRTPMIEPPSSNGGRG